MPENSRLFRDAKAIIGSIAHMIWLFFLCVGAMLYRMLLRYRRWVNDLADQMEDDLDWYDIESLIASGRDADCDHHSEEVSDV